MHIAKIGEKREKTFNFSPFCGIINYIRNKTNLIQMLDFTVFVHISKCIKIVQVKRRIPEIINFRKLQKIILTKSIPREPDTEQERDSASSLTCRSNEPVQRSGRH